MKTALGYQLQPYNAEMEEKYQATEADLSELCDYLLKNDFFPSLQTIHDLTKDWREINLFTKNNLMTHLRNFAVFIENFIKHVGMDSKKDLGNKFRQASGVKQNLDNFLKWIYGFQGYKDHPPADWWNEFELHRRRMASHIPPEELVEMTKAILDEESFHKQRWMSFVIRSFLLTVLARNFSAHNVKYDKEFLRLNYERVMIALFQTLIFVWMHAKKEGIIVP